MHGRRSRKSSSFPRIAGVQWSSTVESTLWGMAFGVAVVLGVVLGPAEIAPASWQLQRVAWRSLWRVPSPAFDVAAIRGSCRRRSSPGQGQDRFRGPCPCRSRVPRREKYKGSTGTREVRGFGSTVAGAVPSTSRTASQVPTVSPQRRGWPEQ